MRRYEDVGGVIPTPSNTGQTQPRKTPNSRRGILVASLQRAFRSCETSKEVAILRVSGPALAGAGPGSSSLSEATRPQSSAVGWRGRPVLSWSPSQREQKTESKTYFRAPPCSRAPLDSGPANRRRRVSPLPWQVAFALGFAGHGRPLPVATAPLEGCGSGRGRGADPGGGRRAEGPGARREPSALKANPPTNVALPFCPCATCPCGDSARARQSQRAGPEAQLPRDGTPRPPPAPSCPVARDAGEEWLHRLCEGLTAVHWRPGEKGAGGHTSV